MARLPTIAEEDAKRPNRERECLVGERTRIVNRMKGTLSDDTCASLGIAAVHQHAPACPSLRATSRPTPSVEPVTSAVFSGQVFHPRSPRVARQARLTWDE